MTKNAALYSFFSSFGIPAYEENSVPDTAQYPYLTYEEVTGAFSDENGAPCSASLWYRSSSRTAINAKAEEISAYIGDGGRIIDFDGGHIWIKRANPFAQNLEEPSDNMVKRKLLNIRIEFFSEN